MTMYCKSPPPPPTSMKIPRSLEPHRFRGPPKKCSSSGPEDEVTDLIFKFCTFVGMVRMKGTVDNISDARVAVLIGQCRA